MWSESSILKSSGKTRVTPTFFVGHTSASMKSRESNSSCWFDAVTFDIERGPSFAAQNGSALDRSGCCPSPECRARDHVAAADNKQITSNRPDRTRSKRLTKDRMLCPSNVPLRMQCASWQGQLSRCLFCCKLQPSNNSAPQRGLCETSNMWQNFPRRVTMLEGCETNRASVEVPIQR